MKIISLILIAVLIAIDQLVKMLVVMHLKPVGEVSVIDNFLKLNYVENTGASFGILQNMTWFISISAIVVSILALIVFFKFKKHNFLTYYSAITIVAGGIGNLIDRFTFGYVIDYIHFSFFPYVFNFADCLVVTGTIVFAIFYLFIYGKETQLGENIDKLEENNDTENWIYSNYLRKIR